jgi:enoyl-CoA hydratase
MKTRLTDAHGGAVATIIGELAEPTTAAKLAAHRTEIDQAFGADTIEAIVDALAALPGAWAQETNATLAQKSPKSLKLTLAAIRQARRLSSLEDALNVEFRLCTRLFEDGEFIEGVRALIIDKDRKPKWSPSDLAGVSSQLVERYLAPLPADQELGLRSSV